MANYEACLAAVKTAAPDLSEKEVGELFDVIETRRKQLEASGKAKNLAEASEMAARELGGEARKAAAVAERERFLNEAKYLGMVAYVKAQFDDNPALGLEARAVGIARAREGARLSASAEQRAVFEEYLGGFRYDLEKAGVYELFTSNSMQKEVAHALWALDQGIKVNIPEEAQKLAEIIRKWQDKARLDQNAEGAWIGKLSDYITRQSHDVTLLRKAAGPTFKSDDPKHFEAWRDFIKPLLDQERTSVDDRFLKEVYTGLVSGDHLRSGVEGPSGFFGPKNIAKKISEGRVLHFKDADAWLAYNERFGMGDVQHTVVQALELAAQNVGLMRVFGTNPGVTLQRVADKIGEGLRETPGKLREFNSSVPRIERMMKYLDGSTRVPESNLLAEAGAAIRLFETMTKLPMMLLSQFNDVATFATEMKYTFGKGFLGSIKDAFVGLGKGLGDIDQKKLYSQIGVFADGMTRDLNVKFGAADQLKGRMADYQQKFFTMVGARWWNDTLRRRAAEVISHNLALEADAAFDALPKDLKRSLSLYQISAAEWDSIRKNIVEHDGTKYVVAEGVGGDAEKKLRTFMADRVDYSVITPTAKTNYYMMWGTDIRRGTAAGEALRFIAQFKGYPIAFTERVLGREIYGRGANTLGEALSNKNGELFAFAQMILWNTAFAYLSLTAKEMAKGREPRDVSDPNIAWRTFLAASLQGGGLGIYSDFLFGEANRQGVGMFGTAAGPALGEFGAATSLFQKAIRGEAGAGEALKEAMRVASGAHPAAAVVLNGYPRIALDYLILYRVMDELSPGYLRRMEQRMRKENGQEYMYPPTEYAIR